MVTDEYIEYRQELMKVYLKAGIILLLAFVLFAAVVVASVSASNAEATAKQVEKFYEKGKISSTTITPADMISGGLTTTELKHNETYEIIVKSAEYNAKEETVVMYINAKRGGKSIKINNPVHFYMPFDTGIHGSSAKKQLDNFNLMLISIFDYFPVAVG